MRYVKRIYLDLRDSNIKKNIKNYKIFEETSSSRMRNTVENTIENTGLINMQNVQYSRKLIHGIR